MVCVFGESGSRADIVPTGQSSPSSETTKRLDSPGRGPEKRKTSTPCKQTGGGKGLGSRHNSLVDVRECGVGTTKTKPLSTPGKTANKNVQGLRASLQQADLTFSRSRTSDAILSRSKRRENDSPSSIVKRRGNGTLSPGTLSPGTSFESLRASRPKSTGTRRKSADERRKKSPEVRRRSAVSPAPTRRRLEAEYQEPGKKKSALRKDLNENNLTFLRSFSADTITRGKRLKAVSRFIHS